MELIRTLVGAVGPGGRTELPLQSLEPHEIHIVLAKKFVRVYPIPKLEHPQKTQTNFLASPVTKDILNSE